MELPVISVIILNQNGAQHLETCLASLAAISYPADLCEFLLVDNASTDGSVAYVREHHPRVRIVWNEANLGCAAANNRGARAAHGAFLVFLNNDTRVDPEFLSELVRPCLDQPEVVCTAARLLDWEGQPAAPAATSNYHAFGYTPRTGTTQDGDDNMPRPVLFASGSAMLVRRDVFLDCGAFDENYFLFLEDLDLGWRLWLMGYRVLTAPRAIAYHRGAATVAALPDYRKAVCCEQNALATLCKNYDADNLSRILPAALLLMFKRTERAAAAFGWNPAPYTDAGPTTPDLFDVLARVGVAPLAAANQFIDRLPEVFEQRGRVQKQRKRSDAEIAQLFGDPLHVPAIWQPQLDERYAKAHYDAAQALGVTDLFADCPRRVLVVSGDVLPLPGLPTTGAGLRAWSLGEGLRSRGHEVVYSMPRAAMRELKLPAGDPILGLLWEPGRLDQVVAAAQPDVVVACGWFTGGQLSHSTVPVVVDQHGPHMLERKYQQHQDDATNAAEKLRGLRQADFFLCAGERQRQYFLPWLARAGFADPEAQSAAIPVSLGGDWPLPDTIHDGEVTFVYGGVFLPWQDPSLGLTTLVERMEALNCGRLRIFGGKHPFIPLDTRRFDRLTETLAQSRHVELSAMRSHDELLQEYRHAHVAIDLMQRNPERELAFTTRTVEYLWCGLPVVYNNYAELADYIGPARAGWCLDPEDRDAMIEVFDQILLHPEMLPEFSCRARQLAEQQLNWEHTIDPLDHFCRHPYRRAARPFVPAASAARPQPGPSAPVLPPATGMQRLMHEATFHYRRGGLRVLAVETYGFARRKLSKQP